MMAETTTRLGRLKRHLDGSGIVAKRQRTPAGATERWYPYYAGFSEGFATSLLQAAGCGESEVVLDPWNGCGTTTCAARSLAVGYVGVDRNPVATLVAAARLAAAPDAQHLHGIVEDALHAGRQAGRASEDEPLLAIMGPLSAGRCRAIETEFLRLLATKAGGVAVDPLRQALPPLAAFLTLALARAIRDVAPPGQTTNPSWVRINTAARIDVRRIEVALRKRLDEMVADLQRQPPVHLSSGQIVLGDARRLPLGRSSVDFVLSSPPYLTRIDYPVNTRLELALLGLSQAPAEFDRFRARFTGTPLTRARSVLPPDKRWGRSVANVLKRVRTHRSSDSASYYYKQYWQYFHDLHRSLREVGKVLKPAGIAVLVLQNSYYKEIRLDLPRLLGSMATELGFNTAFASHNPVDRVLSSINSRSQKYSSNKRYAETALVLARP